MMTEQEHSNVQWRKVKLEEVGEINPSNKEPIPNQFIYIDLESVVAGKLLVENYILKENAPSRAQRLVYNNDVLYQTVRPYQRNNYIHKNQGNYVASTGYALIRCYDDYEPDFVYYLLHTHNFESIVLGLCTGTSYPAIAPNNLKRIKISIPFKNDKPDLSTQHRIAAILASADKVIAATQKLIAKYKQMKQGMMEELFNEQCTMNNVQWRKVRLGEVCMPSSEKYNPLTENTFQHCIEMENINQESGTINGKSDITKLLSLKTKFHKGEVLYGKLRPYLKKYWLADFDGACSTEIWVLKNSENIDNQFLFYLFQSDCINRIANQSSGTKMPRADWKFMEKQTVSIPFKNGKPDLAKQRRIASILSGIDAKIAAEEKVLEKYEKVKKGLMERMLEGENNLN